MTLALQRMTRAYTFGNVSGRAVETTGVVPDYQLDRSIEDAEKGYDFTLFNEVIKHFFNLW